MDISRLTVKEIRELAVGPKGAGPKFRQALAEDKRIGVLEIYRKLLRTETAMIYEARRLTKMFTYEKDLKRKGRYPIAGVDEAGRGPLAGPVVAAAVILPEVEAPIGLDDSKKLTAPRREALANQIKKTARAWSIGISSVEEIFADNIHQASLKAMLRAVLGLTLKPAHVLVDGFKIKHLACPQTPIIGGDALCASIAAASILAKVTRDSIMDSFHKIYPQYGFDRHKGYCTPEHLEALSTYGPCPIHRTGYKPVEGRLRL